MASHSCQLASQAAVAILCHRYVPFLYFILCAASIELQNLQHVMVKDTFLLTYFPDYSIKIRWQKFHKNYFKQEFFIMLKFMFFISIPSIELVSTVAGNQRSYSRDAL